LWSAKSASRHSDGFHRKTMSAKLLVCLNYSAPSSAHLSKTTLLYYSNRHNLLLPRLKCKSILLKATYSANLRVSMVCSRPSPLEHFYFHRDWELYLSDFAQHKHLLKHYLASCDSCICRITFLDSSSAQPLLYATRLHYQCAGFDIASLPPC